MSTEMRKLMLARLEELEAEKRRTVAHLKVTTTELRDLKGFLVKHDRVVKALPKGQFTQAKRGGRKPKADGVSAPPAGTTSTSGPTS